MSTPTHPRFTAIQDELSALQNRLGREPNGLAKQWTAEHDIAMNHLIPHLIPDNADKIDFMNWRFEHAQLPRRGWESRAFHLADHHVEFRPSSHEVRMMKQVNAARIVWDIPS
ncbi:hypothetical protein HBI56_030510 [Parastagonospora nodorum]|nr:hypothetical protein HBH51_173310 [Parastagonospora nodorum]KAH4034887.1 hypothetical protein HBI09_104530 [Parastagonospora nodorum]KAH4059357.1 hypothetical protein HBH49_017160 [Parastagonospora nodorum]KAH4241808.1 hypothetical protein HBI06_018640 [Parastagonospora nodorum]KAH4243213.1 hypothetical protein HBI05_080520 [Parastagonospora nodorum]